MKKTWLKYSMLWHRYLGIGICVFFGIWFVSGIVMIYARMPQLSEADRLGHLRAIETGAIRADASTYLRPDQPLQRLTVGMSFGRPIYRILDQDNRWSAVFADNGARLPLLDARTAVAAVSEFSGLDARQLQHVGELQDVDQWTVYPSSRPYLPFQVVAANDSQRTRYYVSERTGGVYLVTTRKGRVLAWMGAIPHWWYIRALRANTPLWRIVMIVASGIGVVMSLAGIVAGVLRYSPSKRYRVRGQGGSSIPHTGMKRWHYILGYGFGLVTFTWIFSGLASMNPAHWSPGPEASLAEKQQFAGGPLELKDFALGTRAAAAMLHNCVPLKEIELLLLDGQPYYLARQDSATTMLLPAGKADPPGCLADLPADQLLAASTRLVHGSHILQSSYLTAYDAYYYNQHDSKPLPVLRVQLDDPGRTLLYLNPRTGMIQARYTDRSRLERWLYYGLHDLDFPLLYRHRPLWDITVILLSLGGLILSGSGIILSLRYLRRSRKKKPAPVRAAGLRPEDRLQRERPA